MSHPVPLSKRRVDLVILAFFTINLLFITYVVDLEQLVIPDASHFTYPAWPPRAAVDMVHQYGRTFDPLLIARPPWWKMTIWIDALFFGPFCVVAIYAYFKGKEWIRIPSIIYASVMITNVLIILSEEIYGPYASPRLPAVLLLNLPWLVFPILILARMCAQAHPFTRRAAAGAPSFSQPIASTTGLQSAHLEASHEKSRLS
jgi:hypothetical protein